MFLKRIELNGFKSFCNKKEIIINQGITGIVGPNGSGKSNIADAMRWVLGEQSTKNLRASSMQDLIFGGSEGRAPKSYCEVALIFDNSDARVHSEYTEISVKRKMYRSGESEYLINNVACRLKDILDLFRDTGIGKEGYSIISQGKVNEIIDSKPKDRRKVFDEAAGIMKYRVRKEEAERNLLKTRENITRLSDIIFELNNQIVPLRKQMQEAQEFVDLQNRLKTLEINLYLYRYELAEERIKKNEERVKNAEEVYNDLSADIAGITKTIEENKVHLNQLHEKNDRENSAYTKYVRKEQETKGRKSALEEKEKYLSALTKDNNLKREEKENSIQTQKQTLAELQKTQDAYNEQITALDRKYAKLLQEQKTLQAQYGNASDNNENLQERLQNVTEQNNSLTLRIQEKALRVDLLRADMEKERVRLDELKKTAANCDKDTAETKIQSLRNPT